MGWLKRLLGSQAPASTSQAQPQSPPFGLASGRSLALAAALGERLSGHSQLLLPEGPQTVWALGEVDLGDSVRLARFYFDDEDYWLQVLTTGTHPAAASDIVLFGYHRVQPIEGDDDFQRLAGARSSLGLPQVVHDGEIFSRQWGAQAGQARLVPLIERVVNPQARYTVRHLSMLYARDIGLADRREFLLFSVEEDEAGATCLSTSLGVTLHPTEFTVT